MARIFLSHSSRNARETIALYKWLINEEQSLNGDIFLDLDPTTGIPTGANWREELKRAAKRCEAVICLLSEDWDQSDECQREYWIADQLDKKIFGARLEPDAGANLAAKWQMCDLFGGRDKVSIDVDGGEPVTFARAGLRRLIAGIRRAGISVASFPWPPKDDPNRAPYRGWEPFQPADAGIFFGRDGEIARAMDELREMRESTTQTLFVVLGASGAGKSSFLRAGIVPRLRKDDRRFVDLDIVRPELNALTGKTGLAQSVSLTRQRLGLVDPPLGEIKAACLTGNAAKIRRWLLECRDAAAARLLNISDKDHPPTVVLPLDQAEELFAVDAGPEAKQFLRLIRDIVIGEDGEPGMPLLVAATIRTDRYPVMQTAPELQDLLPTRQFDLLPMRAVEFKEVITGPARRVTSAGGKLRVDEKLVERLLADCADGADMLPLLSLTLEGLYRDYGSTHTLSLAAYEEQGGMDRVVQMKVDEVLSHDPAERQEQLTLLRSAFVPWLATINPVNDQPMRRIARYADLPAPSRPLVDAMVSNRLLVKDVRGGEVVVEVALEILLKQWQDLASWLAEERDALKAADNLEHDATEWRNSGHDPSWLLEGRRLANAEKLVATPGFRERLTSTQDYVQESRRKELDEALERQQAAERNARVLRSLLAVTVVVALVAAAGFVWALMAQQAAVKSAKQATAQKLLAEAQGMLAGTRAGTDVQLFQELLAANKLNDGGDIRPIIDALVKRFSTIRISSGMFPQIGVAVADRGHRLAVADTDGQIRVWDSASAAWRSKPLDDARLVTTKHKLASVAISPDGTQLVAGTDDGAVLAWNLNDANAQEQTIGQHSGKVSTVAFSTDGSRLASAGADGMIHLGPRSGTADRLINAGGQVFSVVFDPIHRRLASAGTDGTIKFWNTDTATPEASIADAHKGGVMSVAFSPDGQLLASGGADSMVRLWDTDSRREIGPLTTLNGPGHTETVTSVAFNADGSRLVSAGYDLTVQLWDVAQRQRIGDAMTGHGGIVWSAAFVPDRNEIVSASNDHEIRVWNAKVGQPISTPLADKGGLITSVAISDNRIASATTDGTVQLWDSYTGRTVALLRGHNGVVNSVAFTANGDKLASGSNDGTIRLWRADDGAPITTLHAGRPVYAVAFSSHGNRLASSAGDGQITIWDAASLQPRPLPNLDRAVVFGIAFGPDGNRLASGGANGILRLWDVTTGDQIWQRDAQPGVIMSVAMSPDGRHLASAGATWSENGWPVGVIQRWNADTGNPYGDPIQVGNGNAVLSLAYTPHSAEVSGDRIVSTGFDRNVQLRNADSETGEQISDALTGHQEGISSVAVSPDGTRIVSGAADGTIVIWPNPPAGAPADALCAKLTENMSQRQWETWVSKTIDYQTVCPGLPRAAG